MLLFLSYLDQFYKADRGAHNYYLEKGIVDSRPDHILNLIHYEVRMSFHLYFCFTFLTFPILLGVYSVDHILHFAFFKVYVVVIMMGLKMVLIFTCFHTRMQLPSQLQS